MSTKWILNENQSDVLIKTKDTTITYLGGNTNHFNGYVDVEENEIENASVEFYVDLNTSSSEEKENRTKKPFIRFKSTSFQKIKNNINFLKGTLTIKDITKIVELDAEFIGINNYNGINKAAFEIKGNINRRDFGLDKNFNDSYGNFNFGKDLKLIANLEFTI